MPLFLFTTWRGIADYGILAAMFVTVIKAVDTVNKVYADQVIGLGGVFGVLKMLSRLRELSFYSGFWRGFSGFGNGRWNRRIQRANRDDGFGVAGAVLILGCLQWHLYDANLGGHAERYSMPSHLA